MQTNNFGNLIVLVGPPAAGKDTVMKHLLSQTDLELEKIVTYTSRPIRENEIDGDDYHFVSEQEFLNLVDEGKIIEYQKHGSDWKGTPKGPFEDVLQGIKNYVWRITNYRGGTLKKFFLQKYGAKEGELLFHQSNTIYIGPNDKDILFERYLKRVSNPDIEEFEKRFKEDMDAWRKFKDRYDYFLPNKGPLKETLNKVIDITDKILKE